MKTLLLLVVINTAVFAQSYSVSSEVLKQNERNELGTVSFTVADESGAELYTINKQTEFDIPNPNLVVFDDGSGVLIYAFNGRLEFYNANGNLRFEKLLFKELIPHYERSIYADASEDQLAMLVSEPNKPTELYIYNSFGNEERKVNIGNAEATAVALSHNGAVTAIGTQQWNNENVKFTTTLYNNGTKLAEYDMAFRNGRFVMDDRFLMGYANKAAFVIDVENNDVPVSKYVGNDEVIVSAEFVGGGLVMVTSAKPVYENREWVYSGGMISSYDLSGEMIFQKAIGEPFTELSISAGKNAVIVNENRAIILSE